MLSDRKKHYFIIPGLTRPVNIGFNPELELQLFIPTNLMQILASNE
jgi:hypothetical protein